jgi:Putative Actinobacterial Holin-X, holin superfamily III
MGQAADGAQSSSSGERSTAELVRELSEQASVLVRDELKLAQLELARKGKKAGVGAGLLGGSGLVAWYGAGCLIACAVAALSLVLAVWAAALIVGAALLAVAGALALAGRSRLRKATPPVPQEAAESLKSDMEVVRERARR